MYVVSRTRNTRYAFGRTANRTRAESEPIAGASEFGTIATLSRARIVSVADFPVGHDAPVAITGATRNSYDTGACHLRTERVVGRSRHAVSLNVLSVGRAARGNDRIRVGSSSARRLIAFAPAPVEPSGGENGKCGRAFLPTGALRRAGRAQNRDQRPDQATAHRHTLSMSRMRPV